MGSQTTNTPQNREDWLTLSYKWTAAQANTTVIDVSGTDNEITIKSIYFSSSANSTMKLTDGVPTNLIWFYPPSAMGGWFFVNDLNIKPTAGWKKVKITCGANSSLLITYTATPA